MINIKHFDSNLLKSYKNIHIYYIECIAIKKIDDYENIYSVNPWYLIIGKADGYTEEINENKYLVFASTDENKEVKLWDEIKYLIKTIMVVKEVNIKKI